MFVPYGVVPPIITPFNEAGEFNEPVFRDMIDHLISQGVHGIFPLGTTGEFYAIDPAEASHILGVAVEHVAGRVPVYGGANHITTRNVSELVQMAEEVGCDAVSVLTPMFISQTQDELYEYFSQVAKSTRLPVIIYNNKPKTNVTVEPATIARLAEIPNIVGVKDSTGDMTNSLEYLRLTRGAKDFAVIIGRDTLIFNGLCSGAAGTISSCANVAPALVVEIYEKFQAGDLAGALDAQFRLAPLRLACNMGTFPEVIKEGLMLQGIPVGKCLDPIGWLKPEEKEKLVSILREMQLVAV